MREIGGSGRVAIGASPHAPYTVSGPLYRAVSDLARAHGVPIGVHVAEPAVDAAELAPGTGEGGALLLRVAGCPVIVAVSEDYPGSLLDVRHHLHAIAKDGTHHRTQLRFRRLRRSGFRNEIDPNVIEPVRTFDAIKWQSPGGGNKDA